jgi:hypothetical protein
MGTIGEQPLVARRASGTVGRTTGPEGIGAAPVPRPLPTSLLSVAPFDMSLMPEKLRAD